MSKGEEFEIKCASCNRFLGFANGTVVATLKCKCGEWTQFKRVLTNPKDDLLYKFKRLPKTTSDKLK